MTEILWYHSIIIRIFKYKTIRLRLHNLIIRIHDVLLHANQKAKQTDCTMFQLVVYKEIYPYCRLDLQFK